MQAFSCHRRLVLSPQAFQHACRRGVATRLQASSTHGKQNTSQGRPGKGQIPRTGARNQPTEGEINFFEQDVESGQLKSTVDSGEDADVSSARTQLMKATANLRKYDAHVDSKEFHDTVVSLFPQGSQEALAEALAKERARRQELASSIQINLEPSPLAAPIARELNKHLKLAASQPQGYKGAAELWKWYLRATRNLPGIHASIPPTAWDILWKTQVTEQAPSELRKSRIMDLVEGMSKAGITLSPDQKEARLEALVMDGKEKQALMDWEDDFRATEGRDETNLKHGIKLFAAIGDIRNGTQMFKKYQELFPHGDPRIVHTLIAACAQTDNDHMAYSLYLSLRQKLKDDMKSTDYDYVAARFLAQNKGDLALAVFRDMMIQGTKVIKRGNVTEEEESKMLNSMMYRIDALQSRASKAEDVNKISREALTHLPRQWQNKFFFGKWIKKMIGMNDLDNAAKIIELMYERGLQPDTSYVNGLVGGLLRSGLPEQEKRGETLAWSMICKRIKLVEKRKSQKTGAAAEQVEKILSEAAAAALGHDHDIQIPLEISRPVPRGNMETFNVLGLGYLLKQDWDRLAVLEKMIDPAELNMSAFFMNHLLYRALYTAGPDALWAKFLHQTQATLPDLDTFDCLWQAQQQRKPISNRVRQPTDHVPLPGPRSMFETMVGWSNMLDACKRAAASEAFGEELFARIMSSFVDKNDFPGAVVALHGIHSLYGVGPSDSIKEIILVGLSNVMEERAPMMHMGRRGKIQLAANRSRIRNIRRALGALREKRQERRELEGEVIQDVGLEEVNLLSELVRTILMKIHADGAKVETAILEARSEMGLESISVGDVDAIDVEDHLL